MKEKVGEVFSITKDNEPVPGCTISEAITEGTGLSEHAAPGEALVFALDGEAIIGYEAKEHRMKASETFLFAKGGLHSVKADHRFKMALLLTLE